ncbi:MAG TPA: hypothetical protein VLU92_03935 [Candidatus Dormibacteraeota bacterium]|nr:hypothetical protein [Candidatus Dormibacteraeota bacterium]
MTEQDPSAPPSEAPVEPAFTHPASPFIRTGAPTPAKFPGRPAIAPVASTWVLYRAQIEFGLVVLAFLMVMVGCVTVVQANPSAAWRYYVSALPLAPAGFLAWLFVRAVGRLTDLQKWIQIQAFSFALGMTALVTFAYGFLEGAGMPNLNSVYVLPLTAMLWGLATATLALRYRFRR